MVSCHLCLLISCDSLVFWILSFDGFFCLIAWYLSILYIWNKRNHMLVLIHGYKFKINLLGF